MGQKRRRNSDELEIHERDVVPPPEMVTEALCDLDHRRQLQLQVGADIQQLTDDWNGLDCRHQLVLLQELFKLGELTFKLIQALNFTLCCQQRSKERLQRDLW